MLRYIALRLGQGVFTVFLVISAVFLLIRLAPGDPAAAFAGPRATATQLEAVRQQFGLDKPLVAQYWTFLRNVAQGDLGTSYTYQEPAMSVVMSRFPNTILLALAATAITMFVALPIGVYAARRANKPSDTGVSVLTIAGQSMPDFWLGIMLIVTFALTIPLFPTSGFESWSALALPATTIAILQIALIARVVRGQMINNLAAPYATIGHAHGLPERLIVWPYAFRNAAIPVVTALGTRFAAMLNGVVVVEVVFGWPGVGSLAIRALETRDYPVIQAAVVVTSTLTVVVVLLVDLLYPLLDPRVRLGRGVAR